MKHNPFSCKRITKLVIILCIFTNNLSIGQDFRDLFVPLHSQKTNDWCWAASIEMVKKFHDPSDISVIRQCKIVSKYLDVKNGSNSVNCNDCNCDDNAVCPNDDERLRYSYYSTTSASTWEPDYFELVFEAYYFRSSQEVNSPLNAFKWEFVKNQIKRCLPFIIVVEPNPISIEDGERRNLTPPSDHTVVARGYFESISGEKFIITNDPWIPCEGHISIFPFNIFNTPTIYTPRTYIINKVLTVVHTIYPNRLLDCTSCKALRETYDDTPFFTTDINERPDSIGIDNPEIIAFIMNNPERIAGVENSQLQEKEYNQFLESKNNFETAIKYFDYERLAKKDKIRNIEDAIIPNNEVYEVIHTLNSLNIVSAFQKIEKTYILRKITTYTSLKEKIEVNLRNSKVLLSNLPELEGIPYQLIKYPLFHYEFFNFVETIDGKERSYLVPVQDYNELGLKEAQAYDTRVILKKLQTRTIQYDRGELDSSREELKNERYNLKKRG